MAVLKPTATPGWYIDTQNTDGRKVRKKDGDIIVTDEGLSEATSIEVNKLTQEVNVVLDTSDELTQKAIQQQMAKVQIYQQFKNADLEPPADLAAEVEDWIDAENQRREKEAVERRNREEVLAKEDADSPKWVRNLYPGPYSLRLERQQGEKKKRIELQPRGHRGDMHPLQDEDLNDPILLSNLSIGYIEIISEREAKEAIDKQTHNMQRAHVPLAILRNEHGKPYAPDSIKLEAEFNKQGVVVAYENPDVGKQHENVKWSGAGAGFGGLVRAQDGQPQAQEVVSRFIPAPGIGGNPHIISDGFSDEAKARIADDIARRKATNARPEQQLGLAVTVEPTRRA